jgi:hypothetical protein
MQQVEGFDGRVLQFHKKFDVFVTQFSSSKWLQKVKKHHNVQWHYAKVTERRLALDWEEGATIHQYTLIYIGDERTRSEAASLVSLFNSHMPHVFQPMNHLK